MSAPSPGAAAVLSFVWPGLGQVYAGEFARGFAVMAGHGLLGAGLLVALSMQENGAVAVLALALVIFFWGQVHDAYALAKHDNHERRIPRRRRRR